MSATASKREESDLNSKLSAASYLQDAHFYSRLVLYLIFFPLPFHIFLKVRRMITQGNG